MGDFREGWGRNLALDGESTIRMGAWAQHEIDRCLREREKNHNVTKDELHTLRRSIFKKGMLYQGREDAVVSIHEIRSDSPNYGHVEQIIEQSFPEEERPDAATLRQRLDTNPLFHCCLIATADSSKIVGVITYWTFDDFVYVEHFAIDPAERGRSYGNETLVALLKRLSDSELNLLPVVLEVEHPTTEDARRRIAFYKRHGWEMWPDNGYIQPAYRPGGSQVPMLLMVTPNLDPSQYQKVRDTLYRQVYGVTED